jgi:putative transposase/transposase-like zinc-binding protein
VLELADIVRAAGPQECARVAVLPSQKQALKAIEQCRTQALGGHLYGCDQCGREHYRYHSCGNRHCPKCHGQQTERWLERQGARLLPCSYYLLTFTVPAELRAPARGHQKVVYGLLLSCAAASLQKLCRDPQWLGAQPCLLGVLHTWTRAMLYHPHAHFLVSAGGLSEDGQHWLEPKNPKFLVPVHALSKIFRAKMRDGFKAASLLAQVPPTVWGQHKKWVVHAQHAGQGQKVLQYLARYVFRIAITNSRLESLQNQQVTWRYRDNRTQLLRRLTLPVAQFLTRFLQHVLPKGFTKVRHYGLASAAGQSRHRQARTLLEQINPSAPLPAPSSIPPSTDSSAQPLERCPYCGQGRLIFIGIVPPKKPP